MAKNCATNAKELDHNSLKITDRDMEVLNFLGRYSFASAKDIVDHFWNEKDKHSAYKRLKKLCEAGYLRGERRAPDLLLYYEPTPLAESWLSASGRAPIKRLPLSRASYRTFFHDSSLNKVQQILETSPLISKYQTERELRSALIQRLGYKNVILKGYKIPDGIFLLKNTQDQYLRVALELELTIKSKRRYANLFKQMKNVADVDIVFFVVANAQFAWRLGKIFSELKDKDYRFKEQIGQYGIYYTSLGDLLSEKLRANFVGEGSSFSLHEKEKGQRLVIA